MINHLTKRELQAIFNATEPAEGDDPALASARQKVRDALTELEQDRPHLDGLNRFTKVATNSK